MGKYIGHRLVARSEPENTLWTASTSFCWLMKSACFSCFSNLPKNPTFKTEREETLMDKVLEIAFSRRSWNHFGKNWYVSDHRPDGTLCARLIDVGRVQILASFPGILCYPSRLWVPNVSNRKNNSKWCISPVARTIC